MRFLWLLSLRLAATRADACAAATPQIDRAENACNATSLTLDCSEKYLSIIKCGGITYLFSRKELIIPVNGELVKKHEQRARVSTENGWTPSMPASRAKVFGVSENTAYACVEDTLVAYGGIGEPRVRKVWPHLMRGDLKIDSRGIWRREAIMNKGAGALLKWGRWARVMTPYAGGRLQQIDGGKLSVTKFGPNWLLYGRANGCGAQVARSRDGLSWNPFEPVQIDASFEFLVVATIPIEFFQRFGLEGVGPWVLGCFPSSEGVACAPSVDGVTFAAPRLVVRGSNVHVVDVDDALTGLWIHNGAPSLGTNETESAAAIRARLSGRCRADRDEACENCYSPHSSTLCPFSLTARASAVETGVELDLAPSNREALRWVLPRHARRPPWRLPQHAPLV